MKKYVMQYEIFTSIEILNKWLVDNTSVVEQNGTMYNVGAVRIENIIPLTNTSSYCFLVSYLKEINNA